MLTRSPERFARASAGLLVGTRFTRTQFVFLAPKHVDLSLVYLLLRVFIAAQTHFQSLKIILVQLQVFCPHIGTALLKGMRRFTVALAAPFSPNTLSICHTPGKSPTPT